MTNTEIIDIVRNLQPCTALEIKDKGKELKLEAIWDDQFLNQLDNLVTTKVLSRKIGLSTKGGQPRRWSIGSTKSNHEQTIQAQP